MHPLITVFVEKNSDPQPLLACAATLAQAAQSGQEIALHLLSVREPLPWYARLLDPNTDELEQAAQRALESRLHQLAEPLRNRGLAASVSVRAGKPASEVAHACSETKSTLLIKQLGTDSEPAASPTDLQILREAPCGVLMRKHDAPADFPKRVLAAVAPPIPPSETDILNIQAPPDLERLALNQRVLSAALEFAQLTGAEVHVAHAWHVPGEGLLRNEPLLNKQQVNDYVESVRLAHQEALARFMAHAGASIPPEHWHLAKGSPPAVLADLVKRLGIDLLIMGTVVRSGVPGFLLGSTTESIAREAPCSILALKPDPPADSARKA